ncbi:MAG TPA: hypothetical protein VNR59_03655 [Gaiellaceae bacterium]|jgi:hypothetical protein|nr:hypothetical protein [Gaiellaceae bacterium]HWJ44108.1 hypothetical protein [Gaiellaceae bacterium]
MNLTGQWRKLETPDCASRYPDEIEFRDTRFLARKGPEQGFVVWDVGGYEVLGENEVRVQIATDEQVVYEFTLEDGIVTFVDGDGCRFSYRRVE